MQTIEVNQSLDQSVQQVEEHQQLNINTNNQDLEQINNEQSFLDVQFAWLKKGLKTLQLIILEKYIVVIYLVYRLIISIFLFNTLPKQVITQQTPAILEQIRFKLKIFLFAQILCTVLSIFLNSIQIVKIYWQNYQPLHRKIRFFDIQEERDKNIDNITASIINKNYCEGNIFRIIFWRQESRIYFYLSLIQIIMSCYIGVVGILFMYDNNLFFIQMTLLQFIMLLTMLPLNMCCVQIFGFTLSIFGIMVVVTPITALFQSWYKFKFQSKHLQFPKIRSFKTEQSQQKKETYNIINNNQQKENNLELKNIDNQNLDTEISSSQQNLAKIKNAEKQSQFIQECPICLADFGQQEIICEFPCHKSHQFHESCAKKWFRRSRNCPLCKQHFHRSFFDMQKYRKYMFLKCLFNNIMFILYLRQLRYFYKRKVPKVLQQYKSMVYLYLGY